MKLLLTFVQTYRQIYQHATLFSAVVVGLLFGLFLEAYMHDFNLVYITLFFVFSLAFSAGPIGIVNIGYIKTQYLKSGRLFANTDGHLSLELYNPRASSLWALSLHHKEESVDIPHIKSDSSNIVQLPITPTKRGEFIHDECYLQSLYPISTARLTIPIGVSYTAIIYPQPKGKSLESFIHQEETHYGEEREFDGLQEYDGSQKLSHIHWASVAKGDMSVKVFTKEREIPKLFFYFDKIAGDTEEKLSQLSLWVLECEKRNLPFSIKISDKIFNSPKEEIDVILSFLAKY